MSPYQREDVFFKAVKDIGGGALLPRFKFLGMSFTCYGLEGVRGCYRLVLLFDPLGLRWVYAASQLLSRRCTPLCRFEQADFTMGAESRPALVAVACLNFIRHSFEPVGITSRYRPPPSASLYGLSLGLAFLS